MADTAVHLGRSGGGAGKVLEEEGSVILMRSVGTGALKAAQERNVLEKC